MRPRAPLAWLGLVALAVSACAVRLPPLPLDGRPFVPDDDERALWAEAGREVEALLDRVRPYDDPDLAAYLLTLGHPAGTGAPGAGGGPALRIVVVRDPTLNAFAMPDGRLVVHTGLLAAVESPGQLALILGREVAHVTHRHALGAARAGGLPPVPPDHRGVLGPMAAAIVGLRLPVAATAALTGYGPDRERQADAVALARLGAAGWDTIEAGTIYARLATEAAERGAVETFLLGRPAWLRARDASIRRLLAGAPAVTEPAASPQRRRDFAARLRPVVRDNAAEEIRLGRFTLARRALERVLQADPGDARAHVLEGDVHRLQAQGAGSAADRRAQAEQARARYVRAIALDPALATPHRQLGLLHYALGEMPEARAALERYLTLAPGAADAARIAEYVREVGP